ncbi:MAG: hypothetical protein WC794_01515 [Candidatus Doudnabacteria bacterium]
MDKKTKQIIAWVGAIIIVMAIVFISRTKQGDNNKNNQPGDQQQNTNTTQQEQTTTVPAKTDSEVWVGNLKASDTPSKGNLMLTTTERTIYIKTNRDYSALVGKKVRVSYSGSWQNFVLGDITVAEQE